MPGHLALKTSAALRPVTYDATLAPALPKPREIAVGGAGTWVGTGICDLRASVTSQQKQLDSLIDRVALLLSSMHSEVLQDVRAAVASPDFEARLAEMRKVGEILDQRLAELRAEAAQVPEGVRMLQVELRRVEEKMDNFDECFKQDYEKMQNLVTESLMSVHDRFTSELEGVATELKNLEGRLGSAETDLGLLSDDDLESSLKQAIQQQAQALRNEFPKFLAPYFEQSSARITALEDHLQREHQDLLMALQQAAANSGVQEGDRALQKDLAKRTKEDLRQQSEELSALSRQISEMKVWHSSTVEDAKLLRLESKQRDQETLSNLQTLEERLAANTTRMCHLEDQLKRDDATEKRLMAMEEMLQGMEENMKAVEPLQRVEDALQPRPREVEERLLNALEEKLELVVQDLKRQLETQIQQLTQRDDAQPRELSKSYLEQRLQESSSKQQQLMADLKEELEARTQQAQRQGDDLRRELELKIEKRHASAETSMDDLKHQIENVSAQHQSVSKKQADDLKQLSADVEIRMVKEQSAAQRTNLELRKDLEHSAQEAVHLCGEVLREEQQQLVREFRQELERRLATAQQAPTFVQGIEELQDLPEEVQELKEAMDRGMPASGSRKGSPAREATRLLRTVEETVSEQCRRCDAAAERCERLARQMQWQMNPEAICQGSGVPGEKDAYEGIVLQREGPWSLHESKGRYSFDDTSGWLTTGGQKVGRLICRKIGPGLAQGFPGRGHSPQLKVVSQDVMAEMQKKENQGAVFMMGSHMNGACGSAVHRVEDYRHVDSSTARGQLAVHPAAAQFLLDNAANAERLGGINVIDLLLANFNGLEVSNGFLKILAVSGSQEVQNLKILEKELHLLRCLVMEDLSVKGLRPDKRSMAGCEHRVSLLYAAALELADDASDYQLKAAELILTAQYYGALRYAAESSQGHSPSRRKIFLTVVEGAARARWELVARSITRSLQMMEEDVSSKLNICCLVDDESMASELRAALQQCSSSPAPARELFHGSDSDGSGDFRASPIEESSTESRIMVLMRRVDHQASELQSLREKNEELSEAVDQYNLQQKVSRSLAGLEG